MATANPFTSKHLDSHFCSLVGRGTFLALCNDMLRITRVPSDGLIRLIVEGKLMGPWVDEFRQVCREATEASPAIHLDLSALTFVDSAGTVLLAELIHGGVTIESRSNFVAELLQETSS